MNYRKARKNTAENGERNIVPPERVDFIRRRKLILLIILALVAIVLGVVLMQY